MHVIQYKKFFLNEAGSKIKQLEDDLVLLERDATARDIIERILHIVHTLKSDAATMSYLNMANALHEVEELLIAARDRRISLSASNVDSLFMVVDALRSDLSSISAHNEEIDLSPSIAFALRLRTQPPRRSHHALDDRSSKQVSPADARNSGDAYQPLASYVEVSSEELEGALDRINNLITASQHAQRMVQSGDTGGVSISLQNVASQLTLLRREVVDLKMIPVKQYFVFLSRLVRDLARTRRCFVTFQFIDNQLRFERHVLESLREVCVQLIRNAVTHGFAEGDRGIVTLTFEFKSNLITMVVSDNGRGIDWRALERRAVAEKKMPRSRLAGSAKAEKERLLFEAGVSTSDRATLAAGRGLGWPSIRSSVTELGGQITVASRHTGKSHGTSVQVSVPLTPTMYRAVTWRWGPYHLALPLFVIDNIIQLPEAASRRIGKRFRHRGKSIEVAHLESWLDPTARTAAVVPDAVAIVRLEDAVRAVLLPAGVSEQEVIAESLSCLASNDRIIGVAISEDSTPLTILNHRTFFRNTH